MAGQDAGLRRERGEEAEGGGHRRVVASLEVGPADGAGEEGVPREKRGGGAGRSSEQETDAARRVPRCRQNAENEPSGADLGAVREILREIRGRGKDGGVGFETVALREAPGGVRGGDVDRRRRRGEKRGQRGNVVEAPASRSAARIRGASSPGSTTAAFPAPSNTR